MFSTLCCIAVLVLLCVPRRRQVHVCVDCNQHLWHAWIVVDHLSSIALKCVSWETDAFLGCGRSRRFDDAHGPYVQNISILMFLITKAGLMVEQKKKKNLGIELSWFLNHFGAAWTKSEEVQQHIKHLTPPPIVPKLIPNLRSYSCEGLEEEQLGN